MGGGEILPGQKELLEEDDRGGIREKWAMRNGGREEGGGHRTRRLR